VDAVASTPSGTKVAVDGSRVPTFLRELLPAGGRPTCVAADASRRAAVNLLSGGAW